MRKASALKISPEDLERVKKLLPPWIPGEELGQLCSVGQQVCFLIYSRKQAIQRICGDSTPENFRKNRKPSDPQIFELGDQLMSLGKLHELLRRAIRHRINFRREIVATIIRGDWYIAPMYSQQELEGFDPRHSSNIICTFEEILRKETNSSGATRHGRRVDAVTPHRHL